MVDDRSGLGDLQVALLRLDLRLRLTVDAQRAELTERARDPFRGLSISAADVDEILAGIPSVEAARRLLDAPSGQVSPRLAQLAERFRLDAFEQEALLICLAPELDLRYERLFGYLQDDVTRRRPSVNLLLRLLCPDAEAWVPARAALSESGRLLRSGLLVPLDEAAGQAPLLGRALRVDARIVEYLLGSDAPDPRMASFATLLAVPTEPVDPAPDGLPMQLVPILGAAGQPGGRSSLIYLHGPPCAGVAATARALCAAAGRRLLLVDLEALLAGGKPERALDLVVREATLQNAVLGFEAFDRLLADEHEISLARAHLRDLLTLSAQPTILLGEARWQPTGWLPDAEAVRVELWAPDYETRLRLWRDRLDGQLPADEAARLAARFRLNGRGIDAVIAAARASASLDRERDLCPADLHTAARAVAAPPLDGLAKRIDSAYTWDDIVLPPDGLAQLQELCGRAHLHTTVLDQWGFGQKQARRSGLTALFAGPPGTGKTMAAQIVAASLGLELYRIDLSAVVSKYIGETEKNLEAIFRAADLGDAVLLFDEADAIFGKRSEVRDAKDRYANVEIAYLLQRLETYDGLAILTTNLRGNIDEAFLRRLDCLLELPLPEEPERLLIWQRSLPPQAPLGEDVDLPFLARRFKLSGGHIRNIVLAAAYLAAGEQQPIGMRHLVRGTRREYQKLGKLVAESDFGPYFPLLRANEPAPTTGFAVTA